MVDMPGYEHSIHQDHYKRDSPKKMKKEITNYKTKLSTVPKMAAQTWEKYEKASYFSIYIHMERAVTFNHSIILLPMFPSCFSSLASIISQGHLFFMKESRV